MANLVKSRARKLIEDNWFLDIGWSNYSEGERFVIGIGSHKITMTRAEADKLVTQLTNRLSDQELLEQGNR